jgi:hypothetical protein
MGPAAGFPNKANSSMAPRRSRLFTSGRPPGTHRRGAPWNQSARSEFTVTEIIDFRGREGRIQIVGNPVGVAAMQTGRSAALSSSAPRSQTRKGVIGAWLISSALIAIGLACLPIGSGPSSASGIAIGGTLSNSALKGDRLPVLHAGITPKSQSSKSSIPVGCDAAFSKLVRIGNFSSRCVT